VLAIDARGKIFSISLSGGVPCANAAAEAGGKSKLVRYRFIVVLSVRSARSD
jgi:hypothetical protein